MEKKYFLVKKNNSNSFLTAASYDIEQAQFIGDFTTDESKALHIDNKGLAEWYCYMANHISIDEDPCIIVDAPRFNNLNEVYFL